MAFHGCRQEILLDREEHVDCRFHNWLGELLQRRPHHAQPATQNARQDSTHRLSGQSWGPHHAEVADEAWRDDHPAAARRAASRDPLAIGDILPKELLLVVETAVIDDLAQQLDGGLGTVVLQHGHVHVVDEDEHRGAWRCSKQVFPLPLQAVLEHVHHVGAARLGAEIRRRCGVALAGCVQELLDDDGLAHAGLARNQHIETRSHQVGQQHPLAGGLRCWHQDVEEGLVDVEVEIWHDVLDGLELTSLIIDAQLVQVSIVRDVAAKALQLWPKERNELFA
mmetsp:Transcript_66951/g.173575  ORF Transcript_66951/g.173575 Transcript_66951/m.173575 type:complete len:281 (+) Transcript_66951:5884-6726(+)